MRQKDRITHSAGDHSLLMKRENKRLRCLPRSAHQADDRPVQQTLPWLSDHLMKAEIQTLLANVCLTRPCSKHSCSVVRVYTRQLGDLDGVGVALEPKTSQALPAILVGKIEVPHQVFCGRFLHVELICILLVKEAHFLHTETKETC